MRISLNILSLLCSSAFIWGCTPNYKAGAYLAKKSGYNFDRIEELAEAERWREAYQVVEKNFLLGNGDRSIAASILKKHPKVLSVGSIEYFEARCSEQYDSLKAGRLSDLSYLEDQGLNTAIPFSTVARCQAPNKAVASYTTPADTEQIASVSKASLGTDGMLGQYGTIFDVQVQNLSTRGNQAGSALGSAVAQANYLDNTSWRDYRATGQLAAGLAGAVLGSALNTEARQHFLVTYFVKTRQGELLKIHENTAVAQWKPKGSCVHINSVKTAIDIVNFEKCN